jgi:hypothetical protein
VIGFCLSCLCVLANDLQGLRLKAFSGLESMFSRKIRVEYEQDGALHPCPLKWLDSFSMRNFTNASIFDDTLPTGDGRMEIGERVPLDELKAAMEDWFRKKGYLRKDSGLKIDH